MTGRKSREQLEFVWLFAVHCDGQQDTPSQRACITPRFDVAVPAEQSFAGYVLESFDCHHACSHAAPLSLVQIDIKSICTEVVKAGEDDRLTRSRTDWKSVHAGLCLRPRLTAV